VLTGAGVSAESGLPTFRGDQGVWNSPKLLEFATPDGFRRDPRGAWEWYQQRRGEGLAAGPNPAHLALARWETWLAGRGGRFHLITQNIDGLHQAAGSKNVIELHGSGWVLRCTACGRERLDRTHPLPELPPRCPECGGIERPGVVWFGEMLPEEALEGAQRAARECELFVSVGTSGVVYPAASFGLLASLAGAPTLEVNLEPTPLSARFTWALCGAAGEIVPRLTALATEAPD
jgi:NAD-dependent deacetylase